MSRPLTASDRKNLIRLASELPQGSPERRAILAGLQKVSSRKWHGKVVYYPKGVTVGPDNVMHEGPTYLEIDRSGFYVWEWEGPSSGPPFGPWSLLGPFRSKRNAEIKSAEIGTW